MPQRSANTAHGVAIAILGWGVVFLSALWSVPPAKTAEMTAAQTVAYRFPANWGSTTNRSSAVPHLSAPAGREQRALANLIFDPTPTYGLASASSIPVALPARASAYADPSTDATAESKRSPAGPHAPKVTNNVFNDAQITSIKARLRLTPDQERYWPAVEAALRNITYKRNGTHKSLATVDPNTPAVQQLKAAAMPLIMSFSAEQKSEVRQLARLMGLEQVAQSF